MKIEIITKVKEPTKSLNEPKKNLTPLQLWKMKNKKKK